MRPRGFLVIGGICDVIAPEERPLNPTGKTVRPIQRTTLATAAFEQLIANVVNGTWKAGDRLPPERDLCQQFGIARTSLREAMKAMELVGMLNSRVGDGTYVCPRTEFLSRPMMWAFTEMDKTELNDVMQARLIIEEGLAGLAAENGTNAQIDAINKAVQAMGDCIARNESVLDADMAFHMAVSDAAGNPLLSSSLQMLRNLMRHGIQFKLLLPGVSPTILRDHRAIYQAIKKRNPTAAKKAMRHHLLETMKLVSFAIKQHQR
jgi:GntR family transcriptional regulator, transcriptional repressor for pyruvate dehydrogenase complex